MARRPEPPHLYYRPEYRDPKTGKIRKRGVWCVVDGRRTVVTGCGLEDRAGAEKALAGYLGDKHEPGRQRDQSAADVLVSDVIGIYLRDRVPEQARPQKAAERAVQLLEWWAGKTLTDINGRSCRDYVQWRCRQPWKSAKPQTTGVPPRMVTPAAARRELEDLRAAVNYHADEGLHRQEIKVTLPPRSEARDRYLLRSEAARMIWTAYRLRERMTVGRGPRKGHAVESRKKPALHIARFLLLGIYTGTRAGAIAAAAFEPGDGAGWVDLVAGIWYRQPAGKRKTKKRATPVRIPKRLLAHLRRWKRMDPEQRFVIEFNGQPVEQVNKGFAVVARRAGLGPEVTPHTLRHTCATWLMQRGADLWDAAGYLAMTYALLESVYGHHHVDFQSTRQAAPPLDEIWSPRFHPTIVVAEPYVQAKAA